MNAMVNVEHGFSADTIIETERLILRPLEINDAGWVSRESSRWEVAKDLALVPVPNLALGVELFILCVRIRESRFGGGVRAVILKDTGEPIGLIAAPRKSETAYGLGYWYAPQAWGHGYASEAARALIARLMREGAESFHAGCFEGNDASHRVLEKLGFEETGQISQEFCMAHMKKRAHIDMNLVV
jgi:RimJ/RimL family protein N-acetyltransferase